MDGSIFSEFFNNWVNAFRQEEGKEETDTSSQYRKLQRLQYQMIRLQLRISCPLSARHSLFLHTSLFLPMSCHPDLRPSDHVLSKHPFLLLRFFSKSLIIVISPFVFVLEYLNFEEKNKKILRGK